MVKRIVVTDALAYRIAFVRRCADGDDAAATHAAKVDLADAVVAAVPGERLARLQGLRPRPASVRPAQKRRRA